MRRIGLRLLAYLVIGLTAGPALWVGLTLLTEAGSVPTIVALAPAPAGLWGALFLISRTRAAPGPGQATHPGWSVRAMDGVCFVASALAGFIVVDGVAARLETAPSILGEPLAAAFVAVLFLPAAAVLAAHVTQCAVQRLCIDAEGLVLTGLGGETRWVWREVTDIKPRRQFVVVGRLGLPVARELRVNLVVRNPMGDRRTILDPAVASARRVILAQLSDHAPDHLSRALQQVREAWT